MLDDSETRFGATAFGGLVFSGEVVEEIAILCTVQAEACDRRVEEILRYLTEGVRGETWGKMTGRQITKMVGKYFERVGELWRKWIGGRYQKVLRGARRLRLLREAHDELGHKGVFAVKARLQDRFWWPKMEEDIKWYIRSCHECQTRQMHKYSVPPTVQVPAALFRKVYVDVMHMPSAGGSGTSSRLDARCPVTLSSACFATKPQMQLKPSFSSRSYVVGGFQGHWSRTMGPRF